MVKVFAFDLDGTLTQHKTPLDEKNREILERLAAKYTLIIVGAGSFMRIHDQIGGFPMDVIGNYGMQYAKYADGELKLVRNDIVACEKKNLIEEKVALIREKYGFTQFAGESIEYHASGCLTLSLLGTKANPTDKLAFDPNRKKRRAFYSEVVFVGDDYGVGGNDESVYHSDFRFVCTDDYTRLDEVLAPWMDDTVTDIDELLGARENCACGMANNNLSQQRSFHQ